MHLPTILTTVALALTASALPTIPSLVNKRQTTCSALGTTTTTVGGTAVTLSGPFKITVSGPSATSSSTSYVGNYAHAETSPYPFIVFGVRPNQVARASEFYLDSANHLVTIANDELLTAYESSPGPYTGHVATGTTQQVGNSPLLACSVASDTCELDCSVAGRKGVTFSDSCLASPKYQPDWRLAAPPKNPAGCIPFTPVVLPG